MIIIFTFYFSSDKDPTHSHCRLIQSWSNGTFTPTAWNAQISSELQTCRTVKDFWLTSETFIKRDSLDISVSNTPCNVKLAVWWMKFGCDALVHVNATLFSLFPQIYKHMWHVTCVALHVPTHRSPPPWSILPSPATVLLSRVFSQVPLQGSPQLPSTSFLRPVCWIQRRARLKSLTVSSLRHPTLTVRLWRDNHHI